MAEPASRSSKRRRRDLLKCKAKLRQSVNSRPRLYIHDRHDLRCRCAAVDLYQNIRGLTGGDHKSSARLSHKRLPLVTLQSTRQVEYRPIGIYVPSFSVCYTIYTARFWGVDIQLASGRWKRGSRQVIWTKLTRRAKAYSSSCSQVILVYLHPFRRNSLFCRQKSPKNHVKSIFLGFKVIQGHRCW